MKINYTTEEIEDALGGEMEKKYVGCDILQLSELKNMLLQGWVIFDTKPVINTEDVKILTLARIREAR